MKKRLCLALAVVLALGLSACGNGGAPGFSGGGENGAPPLYFSGHVAKIDESGAFTAELYDMEELDADIAFMLYRLGDYGLEREELKECTALRSAGATCEEAAVLVFTGADEAKTAEDALKDYIAGQIDENTDYRPAEIPKLENAWISRRGETVLLVVANDLDAAKKAVE